MTDEPPKAQARDRDPGRDPGRDPDRNGDGDRPRDGDGTRDGDRLRLTRARHHKVLAGVCQGAGRYFGVDPVIFRIVLAVLSLTGGIGLIVYGLGWLVMPQEGPGGREEESEAHRLLSGRIEGAPLAAVLMTLVGCGLYASMLGNSGNQAFSLILLAATAGAVYWSQRRRVAVAAGEQAAAGGGVGGVSTAVANAVADAPPAAQAPPEPGGSPSWWRDPAVKEPYLWGPDDGPYSDTDRAAWRERKKAERREKAWVLPLLTFLLAVTAATVGTGASWPYRTAGASLEIGLAAALGVFGVAFVISSFAGRARGGTVFFSLLTIAALIGASALPKEGHGMGGRTWRPVQVAAVHEAYSLGGGKGTLDLTALDLNGATVSTRVTVGVGEVELRLPADATVHLHYDLGIGNVSPPDRIDHGDDGVNVGQHKQVTYAPAPGTLSTGTIDVRVKLGVGHVTVDR
ncbi:PspC domain-containing protein [Streptomyces sp. HPF1205]|uniref:PspC domain-containing protein n=1 Tax=Streptomyces sp. HPF1205 TaxID=2873262 RepID=UPI001CEC4CE7|nr:PspC domain-containing protein [Streptomyces sp. HPF1205]